MTGSPIADKELRSAPQSSVEGTDHFIAFDRTAIIEHILADRELAERDRQQFLAVFEGLAVRLHSEFHQQLTSLKRIYAPFDPDSDLPAEVQRARETSSTQAGDVFRQFTTILEQANYRRLDRSDINEALNAASDWGIHLSVDFGVFDQLEVFVRGEITSRRKRRDWQRMFREYEFEIPAYQRLAVIFRLRPHRRLEKNVDTRAIFLKLFKNIPKADIEMLLPGTRIRMSWFDQGRILFPTLSGIGLAVWKIVQGTLVLVYSGLQGMLAFLLFLAGTIGYGARSFCGYLNTRNRYQLSVTRNLYYQNLDSNAGVLFRLLDEAEEQEFREAAIAYYLLWRDAPIDGWSDQQLDEATEQTLRSALGRKVDFDVHGATAKLTRFRLAEVQSNGKWRAVDPAEAERRAHQNSG